MINTLTAVSHIYLKRKIRKSLVVNNFLFYLSNFIYLIKNDFPTYLRHDIKETIYSISSNEIDFSYYS